MLISCSICFWHRQRLHKNLWNGRPKLGAGPLERGVKVIEPLKSQIFAVPLKERVAR